MSDFKIRSDSVDVEDIMHRIRARIREKRGVDYTEEEIRELAAVKLERFLDPGAVRSDLLEHYRKRQPILEPFHPPEPPEYYGFDDDLVYGSSRGVTGRLIHAIRMVLNPVLKLFINPNPIIRVLHLQSRINAYQAEHNAALAAAHAAALHAWHRHREQLEPLNFELLNNLVVEITRLGIENKNLKMRVESLSSRLDFDERRARALEGVVQYRSEARPAPTPRTEPEAGEAATQETGSAARRRRRRRSRRRAGAGGAEPAGQGPAAGPADLDEPPDAPADAPGDLADPSES